MSMTSKKSTPCSFEGGESSRGCILTQSQLDALRTPNIVDGVAPTSKQVAARGAIRILIISGDPTETPSTPLLLSTQLQLT